MAIGKALELLGLAKESRNLYVEAAEFY